MGDPAPSTSSFKLSADQLAGAGLDGLQPGDSFTVTISGTVTDTADGITADVNMASNGEKETNEPGGNSPPEEQNEYAAPKSKIEMGPGSMRGF